MRCDIDFRLYRQPPSTRLDRSSLSTHGAEEWRPVAERCYGFSAACLTVRRSMAGSPIAGNEIALLGEERGATHGSRGHFGRYHPASWEPYSRISMGGYIGNLRSCYANKYGWF